MEHLVEITVFLASISAILLVSGKNQLSFELQIRRKRQKDYILVSGKRIKAKYRCRT